MPETIRIENDHLAAEISSLGAELQSLTDKAGRSFLWHGDAEWWNGRSPILFPIVGKAPNDVVTIDGKPYQMKQHGFARRSEFTLVDSSRDHCCHRLVANAETRAAYPFEFTLELEHRLNGPQLSVSATVFNGGDAAMPYGIGFHPAFCWPLPGGQGVPHVITLENGTSPPLYRLKEGLLSSEPHPSPFLGGALMLERSFFEADAMIFPEGAGKGLAYGVAAGPVLRFDFENLPNLALWQKPGAPFICIEPWHGMAAHRGGSTELADRPFSVILPSGAGASYSFSVQIDG